MTRPDLAAASRGEAGLPPSGGASRATRLLSFAAAPTFAVMAIVTPLIGRGDAMCMSSSATPFDGMVVMYALMSAFHAAPWLRLMAGR